MPDYKVVFDSHNESQVIVSTQTWLPSRYILDEDSVKGFLVGMTVREVDDKVNIASYVRIGMHSYATWWYGENMQYRNQPLDLDPHEIVLANLHAVLKFHPPTVKS